MGINDINHRGAFVFSVTDETDLVWRYTPLTAGELDVGDLIAVTYTGDVLETYPAILTEVLRVTLLDDET